jgi:hypothetical protein
MASSPSIEYRIRIENKGVGRAVNHKRWGYVAQAEHSQDEGPSDLSD